MMQRGDSLFIRVSYVSGGKQSFSEKKKNNTTMERGGRAV